VGSINEIRPVKQSIENRIESPDSMRNGWFCLWSERLLLWGMLVVWSVWRIPIPAVNEPHYWGKAKFWWDPSWCAGDFFLSSSNPHQAFYATFGSLTQWFNLHDAAFAGRIIGLLIVAIGWQSLCQSLIRTRWSALLSMGLFLALQSIGNFSGEWLVGGMESKVPSYGFLFWSLGELLRGRWIRSGSFAGLAICFHPLVGLWGVIGMALASLVLLSEQYWKSRHVTEDKGVDTPIVLPDVKTILLALACGAVFAAPGLIAAITTISGATPDQDRIATFLQVADRLAHHLDPMAFPKSAYWYGGSLLIIWWFLLRDIRATSPQRWWRYFVIASVVIALVGVAIGFGPRPLHQSPQGDWRLSLLKFYPFRLGDLMVPVAVSLAGVQAMGVWFRCGSRRTPGLILLGWGLIFLGAFTIPFPDQNPSRLSLKQRQHWQMACDWLRNETPKDSLVYATDSSWGLRWGTHRPEFVNYKDMPQDAASIVEWNNRLWVISRWRKAAFEDGQVSADELADLRKQTGIRYLLAGRFGPVNFEPVYENEAFRVFELP